MSKSRTSGFHSAEDEDVRVRLRGEVRDAIYDHVFSEIDCEVGGVLVGRYESDGPAVVTAIIPALRASGSRASLTFTHDAWQEIHQQLDQLDPGQIVGWYHSHPGFGIFLSRHDLFIHQNFFSDPRQVAFVVDPHSAREGWFGWQGADIGPIGEETNARRAPQRPPKSAPAAGAGQGPRRVHIWTERITYALAGVAIGVAIWAGLIRNHPSTPQPRSTSTRLSPARGVTSATGASKRRRRRPSSPASVTTGASAR